MKASQRKYRLIQWISFLCLWMGSCTCQYLWSSPDNLEQCHPNKNATLQKDPDIQKILSQQGEFFGCLKQSWSNQGTKESVTGVVRLTHDGRLLAINSGTSKAANPPATSIPAGAEGNERHFRLFIFPDGFSQEKRKALCQNQMKADGYDCLSESEKDHCWFAYHFSPTAQDAHSKTVEVPGKCILLARPLPTDEPEKPGIVDVTKEKDRPDASTPEQEVVSEENIPQEEPATIEESVKESTPEKVQEKAPEVAPEKPSQHCQQKKCTCVKAPFTTDVWFKELSKNQPGNINPSHISVDSDGKIYIMGIYSGPVKLGNITLPATPPKTLGTFVAKLDQKGQFSWAKAIGTGLFLVPTTLRVHKTDLYILGTALNPNQSKEVTFSLDQCNLGTLAVGGQRHFMLKLDNSGKCQSRLMAKSNQPGVDIIAFRELTFDTNSNIYITGHVKGNISFNGAPSKSTGSTQSLFVLKATPSGKLSWMYNTTTTGRSSGSDIIMGPKSNLYIIGYYNKSIKISSNSALGTKSTGNAGFVLVMSLNRLVLPLTHLEATGGSIQPSKIALNAKGFMYIMGSFKGITALGPSTLTSWGPGKDNDLFVAKIDSSGKIQSSWQIGTSGNDTGRALNTTCDGGVVVAGTYLGPLTIGSFKPPQPNSSGKRSIFLAKWDTNNKPTWALFPGSPNGTDKLAQIAVDPHGQIYSTGDFTDYIRVPLTIKGKASTYSGKSASVGSFVWKLGQ